MSEQNERNGQEEKEFDRCVLCGQTTEYPKDMHIDYRQGYIVGAGQLCLACRER